MEQAQEVLMLLLDKTASRPDQEIKEDPVLVEISILEFFYKFSIVTKDLRSYSTEYSELYDSSTFSIANIAFFRKNEV